MLVFNRDMLMNESEIITNCQNHRELSVMKLSLQCTLGWMTRSLKWNAWKKQKEREQEEMLSQYNPFGNQQNQNDNQAQNGNPNMGDQGGGVDEE